MKKNFMKTLNVKPTNNLELSVKWGLPVNLKGDLFVRCDSKGNINWDKAPVYNSEELEKREKVNIL